MPVLNERVSDRRLVGIGSDWLYVALDGKRDRRRRGRSDAGTAFVTDYASHSTYPILYADPAHDVHDLTHSVQVDGLPPEYPNDSLVKLPHISRDWQEHHQGNNFGIVLGGALGLVFLLFVGGYISVRWRRRRIRNPSRITHSQPEVTSPSNGSHVDPAPLLITAERWTPKLHSISELMAEPPALSTLRRGSTIGSPQPSRAPLSPSKDIGPGMYPLQELAPEWDANLPGPSYSHKDLAGNSKDGYEDPYRPYQEEAYFPPSRSQVFHADDLDTPNISASDSDSMQVNIPWRNSARSGQLRTQSLPVESEGTNQEPSSPLTPRNPRHSYSQPLPSSPLRLRALAEEQPEQNQLTSSRPPTVASGKGRSSMEDNASVHESEGSETASTLSSLARLKLRLTGSVPFLPLIEESSPLDTDTLWSRFRGDTPRSSMKSLSSPSRARPRSGPKPPPSSSSHHSPRPHSPPHSASSRLSHPFDSPFPKPASSQPTSPKSAPPKLASPKPASPKPASPTLASPKPVSPPASQPPSPTHRDRPVSPKSLPLTTSPSSTPGMAASGIKLTPDMPAISSPISHVSPWQTHSSPLTLSAQDSFASASSLALRDLSDFPDPPSSRTFPRPLPKRPLPRIPPLPSYLPPKPPVRILDHADAESNVSGALSRHTSPLNERHDESDAPIATSPQLSPANDLSPQRSDLNYGVGDPPSAGPSKLSLIIQ